jgi:hypothetical protein
MAAAVIKGRALVFDCDGVTFVGAGSDILSATHGHFNQNLSLERTGQKKDILNGEGHRATQIFHDRVKAFQITVIVVAVSGTNSIANAVAGLDAWTPKAGSTAIAVDADGTVIDATYNILSARQSRGNTEAASVDLTLEASDEGIDITTVVT